MKMVIATNDVVFVGSSTPLPVQPVVAKPSSSKLKGKGKAQVSNKPVQEQPPADETLSTHRELFTKSRNCTKCGKIVESPRGLVTYSPQVPPPSLLFLLHATCLSCKTHHCRGCFSVITCPASCKGKGRHNSDDCPMVTCCAEGRAIALFEALGGFDRLCLNERATANARAQEASAKLKESSSRSVGPGGTGYAMDHSVHMGYGRGGRSRASAPQKQGSNKQAMAAHWDELLVRAISTVTMFLPSPYSDSGKDYDILPHQSIASLISLSQLPELLGTLLRNDSVTDWIARIDLYHSMLGLLRRMADCELTMQVLVEPRHEMKSSCGLEEWMWQGSEIIWEKSPEGHPIKIPPLYTHFQKLTKQSETFLAGASHMLEHTNGDSDEDTENMVKATSLCGDIIAARDDIERAMTIMGKDPTNLDPSPEAGAESSSSDRKGKGVDPKIELERRYTKACERLAFKYVLPPDGEIFAPFHYINEVRQSANATRNPKDRLHLIKELATTATSLPPGIWVRPHEIRNDVIKIMIAGPTGTPYAGGLFEFDCFLPVQYPHAPPKMNLCTTGGGSVRFNPNLYNCGKVCLSLLGTWAGRPDEMWSPKSTLLQVLVSIQSMILVELPFFNEPGFGQAKKDDPRSISYNKERMLQTTKWAIVDWLKDEHRDGMWADVIASHFTIRRKEIRKCIEEWSKSEPRIRNWSRNHNTFYLDPYSGAYAPTHNASLVQGEDLLASFDQGIELVRGWNVEEE
ncbi:hypothetical protein QCA50_002285 [Cerrena zonata]|uniref:UBC core domain-containing protein n=1 Tax=Cerrena zonata TaxID=2478898 RepID=A0AAW0GYP4_9APHY